MGLIVYIIIIYIIYASIKASKQKQKDRERSQRDWEIIQQRQEFIKKRMEEEKTQQGYQSKPAETYDSWEEYSSGKSNLPKDVKLPPHMRTPQSNNYGRQPYSNIHKDENKANTQQNKFSHRQRMSSVSNMQKNQNTDFVQTPTLHTPPIETEQILNNSSKIMSPTPDLTYDQLIETKPMSMDTNPPEITPSSFDISHQEIQPISSFEVKPVEITPMSFDSLLKPIESPIGKQETSKKKTEDDGTRKGSFFKEYGIEELKIEI